jgi:hypothetical protein
VNQKRKNLNVLRASVKEDKTTSILSDIDALESESDLCDEKKQKELKRRQKENKRREELLAEISEELKKIHVIVD